MKIKTQKYSSSQKFNIKKKRDMLIFSDNLTCHLVLPLRLFSKLEMRSFSLASKSSKKYNTKLLINNVKESVKNLSQPLKKNLFLKGVGYRVEVTGRTLNLFLGYSHRIVLQIPSSLDISCPTKTSIKLVSKNVFALNKFVFQLLRLRKQNVYHKKGIFLQGQSSKIKSVRKK